MLYKISPIMHLDVDKVSSAKDRKRTLVSRRIKGFTAEHRVFRNNNNIIYSVEPLFKQGAATAERAFFFKVALNKM